MMELQNERQEAGQKGNNQNARDNSKPRLE
jgi:hypothetical protein